MNKQDNILIVGGGVIGLCAAYYLALQGRSVVVVEKDQIGAGSSYGNAGLIVPSYAMPLAAPGALNQALRWCANPESPFYIQPRLSIELLQWLWLFLMASREQPFRRAMPILASLSFASLKLYDEMAASLQFSFSRRGGLHLFNTRQGLEEAIKESHWLRALGIESQVLDPDGVHQLEPELSFSITGGIYYPQDAHLVPDHLLHELARCVEGKGVRLETSTEVLGFELSRGRISAVITTHGTFQPEQVILAAGAWSPVVARELKMNLPVQAAKGYSLTIAYQSPGPSIPLHLAERKVVVTPMGERLRFAGTLELTGLNLSISRRRVMAIQRAVHEYLPDMADQDPVEVWRGLRPLTPDSLPIIGRSQHIDNLVVATGHGMLGVSLGPVTGKLVAQIVAGESPLVDPSPFRAERF